MKRIVITALIVVFFVSLGWIAFIHVSYAYWMPGVPQPELGRTHEIIVNHGFRVYVTHDELQRADFVLHRVFWVAIASLAGLGIVKAYWK